MDTFKSKDDVFTLMVHLGYLTYNEEERTARIPNEEVKNEFVKLIDNSEHTALSVLIDSSRKLLNDISQKKQT